MLQGALDPAHPWQTQVEQALGAYLACMAESPVLMRTLFVEILGLGAEGLAARRRVNQEIADFILGLADGGAGGKTLPPQLAMAIVGGINELILQYIEQDRVASLQDLVAPSSALVRAVMRA